MTAFDTVDASCEGACRHEPQDEFRAQPRHARAFRPRRLGHLPLAPHGQLLQHPRLALAHQVLDAMHGDRERRAHREALGVHLEAHAAPAAAPHEAVADALAAKLQRERLRRGCLTRRHSAPD
jgi:hypothetical protein